MMSGLPVGDKVVPLRFCGLDVVLDRWVGRVWLKVVCRWVAMDERPPGLLRAPWPLIEICESSLVRELSARPSVVAVSDCSWRTDWHACG